MILDFYLRPKALITHRSPLIVLFLLFSAMLFTSCKEAKDADEPKSAACDILLFSIDALTWTIDGTNITRPYPPETSVDLLTPTIILSPGASVNPPAGEAQNFFTAEGVKYTVTAADGVTTKVYIAKAMRTQYSECAILSFTVDGAEWTFTEDSLITYACPAGTVETLLTPTITLPAGATVDPPSGVAQNFFTAAGVRYTVTSEDGATTKTYIARIRQTYSNCDILSFSVNGIKWTIDDTLITWTYSTEILQTYMTPTIVLSPGARVSPSTDEPQNFFTSSGVRYTVTSEDGLVTKTYTAKATHVFSGATGNCIWTFSSGRDTLTISGNGAMDDYGDGKMPFWEQYSNDITTIIITEGVTSIGERAFLGSPDPAISMYANLTSVIISNSVKATGYAAFAYCYNITSVTMGNSIETFGDFTFYDCRSLESVVIPNSAKIINYAAFYGCQGLTSLTMGNSLTNIERWAFFQCNHLKEITIPSSVTIIGEQAFGSCTGLTTVTNLCSLPQNIHVYSEDDRGYFSFYDVQVDLITLKVPSAYVNSYKAAAGWNEFKTIIGI